MTDSPEAVAYRRRKLGTPDAHPKIVAQYLGASGWEPLRGRRLDRFAAEELLREGVTIVQIQRRCSRVEVGLRRYLGAVE